MLVINPSQRVESFEQPSIFLGGAITGASDWQSEAAELLKDSFGTCFNPRRPEGFASLEHPEYIKLYREQVEWEHNYLKAANVVLFWMPKEAVAITTRFEVGWCYGMQFCSDTSSKRPFVVGIEPETLGYTYYSVVLPDIGVPIFSTLFDTCMAASRLVLKS